MEDAMTKIYSNTKNGVLEFMEDICGKDILDTNKIKANMDSQANGTWRINSPIKDSPIKSLIIYLAGYKDQTGKIRQINDFEEVY
jgi:hypothetical protein